MLVGCRDGEKQISCGAIRIEMALLAVVCTSRWQHMQERTFVKGVQIISALSTHQFRILNQFVSQLHRVCHNYVAVFKLITA